MTEERQVSCIRIPLRIHQVLFALEDRRVVSSFAGYLCVIYKWTLVPGCNTP